MIYETAFTIDASSIKYGPGVTKEAGQDRKALGVKRAAGFIDPYMTNSRPINVSCQTLTAEGIDIDLYNEVSIEPADASFKQVIAFADEGDFEGFVAIGGRSTIETAKAAKLFATYPANLLTYVNASLGEGRPVPGAWTFQIDDRHPHNGRHGQRNNRGAIFELLAMKTKTGIAHRALRPTLGLVEPENTRTMPAIVAACPGLDVLCRALKSFTAFPFNRRPAAENSAMRPSVFEKRPLIQLLQRRASRT